MERCSADHVISPLFRGRTQPWESVAQTLAALFFILMRDLLNLSHDLHMSFPANSHMIRSDHGSLPMAVIRCRDNSPLSIGVNLHAFPAVSVRLCVVDVVFFQLCVVE